MGETATRDDFGLPKVYSSPKPFGTTTYYTGVGDDAVLGIGKGNRIALSMTALESTKSVDIYFNDDVYIRGGFLQVYTAPAGAYMEFSIHDRNTSTQVAMYSRSIWLINGTMQLNSSDRAVITPDLFMRMTIHNSDPITYPTTDAPAATFKVFGVLELFRSTTV